MRDVVGDHGHASEVVVVLLLLVASLGFFTVCLAQRPVDDGRIWDSAHKFIRIANPTN